MENLNPIVRVSNHLTVGNLKSLLRFVAPHAGSPYVFVPITGDFIDGTFREFKLLRCQKAEVNHRAKQIRIDTAIRRWCMDFGLENPVITW